MKYIIRSFIYQTFAIWFVSRVFPAFVVRDTWQAIMLAGAALTVLMIIVAPILRILLLPINIITFGLLSWLSSVILVYLLTLVVAEVRIESWTFPGLSSSGLVIPKLYLSYPITLVVTSFLLTLITNFLHWTGD